MKPKILKTNEDYLSAIGYLERLGDQPDFENNKELIDEFELIEQLISLYERENFPIENGNPIEIIKLKMNYMGLKQKDLVPLIGSKGVVSEVINYKRKLSKKMIRELSNLLDISQEILNTDYKLANRPDQSPLTSVHEVDDIFHIPIAFIKKLANYKKSVYQRGSILNVEPI